MNCRKQKLQDSPQVVCFDLVYSGKYVRDQPGRYFSGSMQEVMQEDMHKKYARNLHM